MNYFDPFSRQSAWRVLLLLIVVGAGITLPPAPWHNILAIIATLLVYVLVLHQHSKYPYLRPHLITLSLYLFALSVDLFDDLLSPSALADRLDRVDDLLQTMGFVLISLSFMSANQQKLRLIEQLNHELLRSQELERELREQTQRDELTGLGNRRALFQQLKTLHEQQARGLLLYLDLNQFKQLNDLQGHQRGDQALCDCARMLKRFAPDCFRLGGDEFVLLLPDQGSEQAEQIMLQLHKQAQPLTLEYGITLSIGFQPYDASWLAQPDRLLSQADHNMYRAKYRQRGPGVPT